MGAGWRQRSPRKAADQVKRHLQESQAVLSQVVLGGQGAQALLPVPQAQQSQGLPVTQVSEYKRGTTLPLPPAPSHTPRPATHFLPFGPNDTDLSWPTLWIRRPGRDNQDPGPCLIETGRNYPPVPHSPSLPQCQTPTWCPETSKCQRPRVKRPGFSICTRFAMPPET